MTEALNSQAKARDEQQRGLLAEIAKGSKPAFVELYEQVYTSLIRFLYRFTRSTENIEEIANDTMLVVWQKAATFQGQSRISTWIMGIAMRRALKYLEKEKTVLGSRNGYGDEHVTCATDEIATLGLQQTLDWALAQLSREHSVTIELAYFHGLSCEEIACVFDCPVSTAKTRLHYARKHLRELFDHGSEPLNFANLVGGRHDVNS